MFNSTNSFDIKTLLKFNHAKFLCTNCYAMLDKMKYSILKESDTIYAAVCPVCKVNFLPTNDYPLNFYQAEDDFQLWIKQKSDSTWLEFSDLIGHSRSLAKTISEGQEFLNSDRDQYWRPGSPPLRTILMLLKQAQKYVHFITYGSISHQLIGVLKLVALDIPVRGIISNAGNGGSTIDELTQYTSDAPHLNVRIFESKSNDKYKRDLPHQKLVIIDGLVALKGSANLTLSGYRKAEKDHEILEFVTETEQVLELNNRYFSPIYGELSNVNEIRMYDDDIPF